MFGHSLSELGRSANDGDPPTRSGRFPVGPARGHRLETVSSLSAFGATGNCGRRAFRTGLYVIRVKLPSGVKLTPHQHPEDRVYTVMSGAFYVGPGSRFDEGQRHAYPPGAVTVLPGGAPHFHWTKSGAYVTQVSAIGPLGLEYIDPTDDPRNQ